MAGMYSSDNVANIGVATADAGGVAQATLAASKAKAPDTLFGDAVALAGGAYNMYVEGDMQLAGQAGERLSSDMLLTNKNAAAAQKLQAGIGQEVASVERGIIPPTLDAAEEKLAELKAAAARLSDAANGGMSPEEYVTRVEGLSKKYVAKYPGLADKVREIVGRTTGMPGADLWAAQQYVRDRLAKPAGGSGGETALSPEKLALKDIEKYGPYIAEFTTEQLGQMWSGNNQHYSALMRIAKDKDYAMKGNESALAQAAAISKTATSNAAALRAPLGVLISSQLSLGVLNKTTIEQEKRFASLFDTVSKGGSIETIDEYNIRLEEHRTNITSILQETKSSAYNMVAQYGNANPNAEQSALDALYKGIDQQLIGYENKYSGKEGMFAFATALGKYKDKTMTEKMQLVDLNTKMISALKNEQLVSMYARGPGDAGYEKLKRDQPGFFSLVDGLYGNQNAFINSAMGMDGKDALAQVDQVLRGIGATGVPPASNSGINPTVAKVANEVAMSTTQQVLMGNEDLTKEQRNTVSAALTSSVLTGHNYTIMKGNWKAISANLGKGAHTATVEQAKAKVSNASIETVNAVRTTIAMLAKETGVTLEIGVNSEGELAPIPPSSSSYQDRTKPLPGQNPNDMDAPFKIVQWRDVAERFINATKPRTSSLVYTRAALTGQAPADISKEYVEAFKSKSNNYAGWYHGKYAAPTGEITEGNVATSNSNVPRRNAPEGQGGTEPSKKAQGNWWE
jgi:hypothetical protein